MGRVATGAIADLSLSALIDADPNPKEQGVPFEFLGILEVVRYPQSPDRESVVEK